MITRMAGKHPLAQSAFRHAASISMCMLFTRTPARMIAEMRTLAPVLLKLLLDAEQGDAEELATLFETVTVSDVTL